MSEETFEGQHTAFPDGLFKEITQVQAQQLGLISIASELQIRQSTRSDLVFKVPAGLNLSDTLFYFFLLITLLEFKSENDTFDEREFYKNVMRVYAIFIQDASLNIDDILNVFVLASTPVSFFKQMEQRGQVFAALAGQPWHRQGKYGNQQVVFIICELLPLEEKYYAWLLFAPAKGRVWHDFIMKLIKSGEHKDLLEVASQMRPKEFKIVIKDYRTLLSRQLDPREMEQLQKEREEANEIMVEMLQESSPSDLKQILQKLKPEERLSGLKPEERLSGLKPEERLVGLKPEERLVGLKPEEVVNGMSEAQRAQMLKLLLEQNNQQK